jgi:hypothetical protein
MNGPSDERVTEWTGGSLNELMIVLSAAALPARIRVFAPGPGDTPAGEVHLLAGGLNDAFAGDERGEQAVSALQRVAGARFLIDTRLPDPETGSLSKPGPAEGNLARRPLVEIMRYCEEYVLTCTLEVWRGEDQARISYRRGELVGTTVRGSDAPERLPEVMAWKEGFFELVLPLPVTPPVPALSKRSTASMATAGSSAGTRPPIAERVRRPTDPLITVDAAKKGAPAQPAGTMARPTGDGGSKLPPGPPMPGLQARGSATVRSQPTPAAGPQPAPSGPKPATPLAAAPIKRSGPLPSMPVRAAQTPIAARTTAGIATAHPLSTSAGAAQAKRTPPLGLAVAAPKPPTVAPGPPVASAPVTARAPQAPLVAPSVAKPVAPAASASPRAPLPSLSAKPSVAQTPARSVSAPATKTTRPTPAQGSGVTPPPVALPVSPAATAVAVQHATPSPAKPPSAQPAFTAAAQKTGAAPRPRPSEPPSSPPFSAIHGALTTTPHSMPSVLKRTPGEMRRSLPPASGTEKLPDSVELSQDMQDPAAYVQTPPPEPLPIVASVAQSTPRPVSSDSQRTEVPTVRLSNVGFAPSQDLSVDVDEPRFRPGKRRARRGVAHWPLLVHVLLGVALGAAIVAAYSAYYGLPIP